MEIGTIKAVHISIHRQLYVTAELELNVKGVNYHFGGHEVFRSGLHGGEPWDAPYLGRFLFRCMQVCGVESWELLKNSKVQVERRGGKVSAIGDIAGHNWFNLATEFEAMEREREQADLSVRDSPVPPSDRYQPSDNVIS